MTLVNPEYSINPHEYFILQDKKLKVVGTDGENKTLPETIDTILNLETKKRTKVTRQKLKSYEITNWVHPTTIDTATRKSKKPNRLSTLTKKQQLLPLTLKAAPSL